MLGSPGLLIIDFIFSFESLRITASVPEFRLFHMDCLHPHVHGNFHALRQIFRKRNRRHHVRHGGIMNHIFAASFHLPLVPVLSSVPFTVQIILVLPPCNTGHQMEHISFFPILPDPVRHSIVNSVNHDKVTL